MDSKQQTALNDQNNTSTANEAVEQKENNKKNIVIPKGAPKGGRTWKDPAIQKFTSMKYEGNPQLKTTWDMKKQQRDAKRRMKDLENQIIEDRKEQKREHKKKIEEHAKRRAQNELRSAKIQVLSDPTKIKAMSKKQLRQIKKSRMNANGEIEYVSPYAK
ncbi:hypothetical protein WA158_000042 [Blastocystis sp. Blastoise]